MCSASRAALIAIALAGCSRSHAEPEPLRVCSDPNNLPFSNERGEGFENKLAELVAHDLGREVRYVWFPQRRGFIKNTLRAHKCDVVIGEPAGYDMVLTTKPYYRSTYVFVTRADRHLALGSLDDPELKDLKIGIHAIGDDYANTPAAASLARRGMAGNIVGFSIYGDYAKPNPPQDLIDAVARGDIDAAIAWGPLAGYAAKHSSVPLTITPVTPAIDPPGARYTFPIAMGVRKGDRELQLALDRVIARDADRIAAVLDEFGVPRLALQEATR